MIIRLTVVVKGYRLPPLELNLPPASSRWTVTVDWWIRVQLQTAAATISPVLFVVFNLIFRLFRRGHTGGERKRVGVPGTAGEQIFDLKLCAFPKLPLLNKCNALVASEKDKYESAGTQKNIKLIYKLTVFPPLTEIPKDEIPQSVRGNRNAF